MEPLRLTKRQHQIVQLKSEGLHTKLIAKRLGICVGLVMVT